MKRKKKKPIPKSIPERWLPKEMPKVWTQKDGKKESSKNACRGKVQNDD